MSRTVNNFDANRLPQPRTRAVAMQRVLRIAAGAGMVCTLAAYEGCSQRIAGELKPPSTQWHGTTQPATQAQAPATTTAPTARYITTPGITPLPQTGWKTTDTPGSDAPPPTTRP